MVGNFTARQEGSRSVSKAITRILQTLQTLQMPQSARQKGNAFPTYKPDEVELDSLVSHWVK